MPFVTRPGLDFAEIDLMHLPISAEVRDYTSFQCSEETGLKHIHSQFVREITLEDSNSILRPSVTLSTGAVGRIGYRIF